MRRRWTGRPRRDEFAPVSAELLIAIASTKMTDAARRVLLALIASSYGRYREHDVPLRRAELEALTSLPHGQISKAITELQERGILTVQPPSSRGKRAVYRIEKRYRDWTPATELHPKAETTWRSVPVASERSEENGHDEPHDDRSHENGERSPANADRSHENGRPPVLIGRREEGLEAADAALIAQLEADLDTPWPDSASTLPAGGPIVTGRDLPPAPPSADEKRSRRQLTPGDDLEVARAAAAKRHGRKVIAAMREPDATPASLAAQFGPLAPGNPDLDEWLWGSWLADERGAWESRFDPVPMTQDEIDAISNRHGRPERTEQP